MVWVRGRGRVELLQNDVIGALLKQQTSSYIRKRLYWGQALVPYKILSSSEDTYFIFAKEVESFVSCNTIETFKGLSKSPMCLKGALPKNIY